VPTQAQEFGRLFLTPEQRATLDARRKARIPDKPSAVAQSPVSRLDGVVRRRDGRSTVWVDGSPNALELQSEGPRIEAGRRDPLGASLPIGEADRRVEMRAGERLDRGSGEVKDVLGAGALKVGPGRAASK
jgi:hypothetical protein